EVGRVLVSEHGRKYTSKSTKGVGVAEETPVRRLPRAQRREQILVAATEAFARSGFAATGLDDIASQAGVTRVILYRHFDSKTDLYQAVLDRMCARLDAHVEEPVGGVSDANLVGPVDASLH